MHTLASSSAPYTGLQQDRRALGHLTLVSMDILHWPSPTGPHALTHVSAHTRTHPYLLTLLQCTAEGHLHLSRIPDSGNSDAFKGNVLYKTQLSTALDGPPDKAWT